MNTICKAVYYIDTFNQPSMIDSTTKSNNKAQLVWEKAQPVYTRGKKTLNTTAEKAFNTIISEG